MPCSLPKTLAEKYEAELGQSERQKVDVDDDPLGIFKQIFGQDEGAHATYDQVEYRIVQEPAYPVCSLVQAHHLHGFSDTCLLLAHHSISDSESGREETQKSGKRQESVQDIEHELVVVEGGRFVRHGDHGYARVFQVSDLAKDDIGHPVLELRVPIMHILVETNQVRAVLNWVPRRIKLARDTGAFFIRMHLIVVVHVKLVATVTLLDDLKAKAYGRPILADSIVRVLQVVAEQLRVVKLTQCEVMEHVRCVLVLSS